MSEIKSGEKILEEFFESITSIQDVDKNLANKLKELYRTKKFTETYVKNMIDKLLDEEIKNET